jgi:DNA mismatch endonuclease (patch repair protein)
MADKVSKEVRSRTMKAVKSTETKIETEFRKVLWSKGIRYRKNVKKLLGKPDIALQKAMLVVFIDSCFWHGCKEHCRIPTSNVDYWTQKIQRNIERDMKVTEHYKNIGWKVIRAWEHEIKNDKQFEQIIDEIINYVHRKGIEYSP